jgi:hypothetical protein
VQIRSRTGLAAFAVASAVGLGAGAATAAAPTTMPAAPPTDARAADLTAFAIPVAGSRIGGKAQSFRYGGADGGVARVGPFRTTRFTGRQTVVVHPPAGRQVLQGFATISGGQTGSMIIAQTRAAGGAYVVWLQMPGEQGRPGRLTIQVQTVPKEG